MIATSEIKVGSAFMFEGNPFIVQKKLGQQGGRQGITVKLRVKNIATGGTAHVHGEHAQVDGSRVIGSIASGDVRCHIRQYDIGLPSELL